VTRSGQILFDAAVAAGLGLALPLAIGVAILRYRLYAIDRIISRTVAYAIVTGLLAGVYTGLVLLATRVLSVHTPVAVAVATLAAAALFSPLRQRVQRVVDRRFNRARYDADQTVAAFAALLKDAVDLDSVCDDLAGVVQQALEPAHISIWVGGHARDKALSGPGGRGTMMAGAPGTPGSRCNTRSKAIDGEVMPERARSKPQPPGWKTGRSPSSARPPRG
jgi:hypothetical protein